MPTDQFLDHNAENKYFIMYINCKISNKPDKSQKQYKSPLFVLSLIRIKCAHLVDFVQNLNTSLKYSFGLLVIEQYNYCLYLLVLRQSRKHFSANITKC